MVSEPEYRRGYDIANSLGRRLRGQRARRSRIAVVACAVCDRLFTLHGQQLGAYSRHSGGASCSPSCKETLKRRGNTRRKLAEQKRTGNTRRSRLKQAAIVENIGLADLAARDKYRCHLCGKRVDTSITGRGPQVATIDHLVPLSLGGDHSWANVALAHKGCNSRKAARGAGEQLMLIGRW